MPTAVRAWGVIPPRGFLYTSSMEPFYPNKKKTIEFGNRENVRNLMSKEDEKGRPTMNSIILRLAGHSANKEMEFKNEVQLVARVHHKNLVRLLGFCLEHLDWEARYSIIEGIAYGMLYLHKESQLGIIYRHIKASNIFFLKTREELPKLWLLTECYRPKHAISWTFGYMATEYGRHEKISIKINVFSFGVLTVEMMSEKRNNRS
ncbi:hypothetical protein Cgig2_033066 [Carnegiea gigantea]|uniref:Protein kinase domain-containing protein n=1 Tax=Carnegiea gigantea TaxID=171969 RepID=A0A9Q1GUC7_9CARY|nr:hypothetical protein Cgig2_033066 [Carnegiea gigantea]